MNLLGPEQSTDKEKYPTFPVSVVCSFLPTLALTLVLSSAAPFFPDPLLYLDYSLDHVRGAGVPEIGQWDLDER